MTTKDVAGIERTEAGRPIDAPPGSRDAANTGMQHDAGNETVTNTVSQEPTHSDQIAQAKREMPDAGEGDAPSEDQATHQ